MEIRVTWFEIPVTDFERAKTFYEAIFEGKCTPMNPGGNRTAAILPLGREDGGGSILKTPGFNPSPDGVLIYLHASEDLQTVLDRVVKAGGKVTMEKFSLGEGMGYIATFQDSEGNTIGLTSAK